MFTLLNDVPENSNDDFGVLFSGGNSLSSEGDGKGVLDFFGKTSMSFETEEEDDSKD